MQPRDFVNKYLPYAKQTEEKTGVSALAVLAQAALESGYGEHATGNMFFGVKCKPDEQNKQLLTTLEYSRRADLKFPEVISVTPVTYGGLPGFKYKVKDWFRKYDTPEESFTDHIKFILSNPRYAKVVEVGGDPVKFIDAISAAGYATEPNYATLLKSILITIEKYVNPTVQP